jgi:hypothetical protein
MNDHQLSTPHTMSLHFGAQAETTLQSWKEIALELNRGVRTVQRWERDLKMPVRRIGKGLRAPVFAFKSELHRWLRSSTGRRARRTQGTLHNTRLNSTGKSRPNVDLQVLEKMFAGEPSRRAKKKCIECGSPMQFLKGQFWIYGTRKKWNVSIPLCPVCNEDVLNTHKTSHQIQ